MQLAEADTAPVPLSITAVEKMSCAAQSTEV